MKEKKQMIPRYLNPVAAKSDVDGKSITFIITIGRYYFNFHCSAKCLKKKLLLQPRFQSNNAKIKLSNKSHVNNGSIQSSRKNKAKCSMRFCFLCFDFFRVTAKRNTEKEFRINEKRV